MLYTVTSQVHICNLFNFTFTCNFRNTDFATVNKTVFITINLGAICSLFIWRPGWILYYILPQFLYSTFSVEYSCLSWYIFKTCASGDPCFVTHVWSCQSFCIRHNWRILPTSFHEKNSSLVYIAFPWIFFLYNACSDSMSIQYWVFFMFFLVQTEIHNWCFGAKLFIIVLIISWLPYVILIPVL